MTKRWVLLKISGLLFLGVIIFMPTYKVKAEDPGRGFTITPPVFELKANPGDKISESISLFNNGSEDIIIATSVENLKPIGDKGQVSVVDGQEQSLPSLKDWIVMDAGAINLVKGETKNIKFDLNIPQNAEPGGHFATVLFTTANNKPDPGTGSLLSQKVGSLVFLTVAGTAQEKVSVISFSASNKILWKNQIIDFMLKVKNSGNVYVRPRGFLIINDIFGRKVAEVEVDGKNVLPTAVREIPLRYDAKHLFGPYTATLSLVYGSTNQNINVTTGFWVIPLVPTVVVLLIIIILILMRKRLWLAMLVLTGKKKIN